jgi:hypothetical protein
MRMCWTWKKRNIEDDTFNDKEQEKDGKERKMLENRKQ